MVTRYNNNNRMADGVEDFFLCGDDFDAILDLLEHNEDMEEQFKASVENVSMICFLFEWYLVHNAKILTRYALSRLWQLRIGTPLSLSLSVDVL